MAARNPQSLSIGNLKSPRVQDEPWITQPEPMFPIPQLREAYLYYHNHAKGERSAENFFNWLYMQERDVPFNQQKHQP